MSRVIREHGTASDATKEIGTIMHKRFATLAALVGAAVLLLAALPAASASAASPWWQVLSGSRPTNLWEPADAEEVQEVKGTSLGSSPVATIFAVEVEVGGEVIGCLGTGSFLAFPPFEGPTADELCEGATGYPASKTHEEFEEMLEGPYGAGEVKVTGGPAGSSPFEVQSPWGPPIELNVIEFEVPFIGPVSYTHLRAHETVLDLVCRLLLEKKKKQKQ